MQHARAVLEQALSGRYTLERELGRGGMAIVFLARDLKHDRLVALKVLLPEVAQHLGPERFQREIHVAARLQHPHILTVHDSGESAGQLWFTMPYVEGESLRDRLKRERQLSVPEAVRIAQDVGRALEYAHEHGVVHRDIKPENILLTTDGSTLVADFGIARSLAGDDRLTQTGMAIGTPAYMSPEQATGDTHVDPRSDTYSLAAVLYEMLAGEPPFTGPTAQAVIARRFSEPPPSVRRMRPAVASAIDEAIQQGMASLAADRFATTSEFVRALATGPGTTRTMPVTARTGRRLTIPLAFIGLLAVGALAWAGWRQARQAQATDASPVRAIRVAVLPFENRGDSGDAYFADGMAEAVRAKLTNLPGLAVIARASSESYVGSTMSLPDIARELGVDFLLSGTVRWARSGAGTSRVRVNPELIEIVKGQPQSRWQQPFDAPVDDVFRVQGDIAGQVAAALNVRLTPPAARQLGQRPTTNLAAYDAFLKAAAVAGWDLSSVRRSAALYEEAATLDSSFAQAWANWARNLAVVASRSGMGMPSDRDKVLRVLARAVALDSVSVDVYRARMQVAHSLTHDEAEVARALAAALVRYPNDPSITRAAGVIAMVNGQVDSGLILMARAVETDPRSYLTRRQFGDFLNHAGRQEDARTQLDVALSIAPGDYTTLRHVAETWIAEGNLEKARQSISTEIKGQDGALLAAYLASNYLDWLLPPAQVDAVLKLGPTGFGGDSSGRALTFARIHHARGDSAGARKWGDLAYRFYDAGGAGREEARSLAGISLAYQGRYAEAIRDGKLGLVATPVQWSADRHVHLARIYALAGEPGRAMDEIAEAYRTYPSAILPGLVRLDPMFTALRNDPRVPALHRATTRNQQAEGGPAPGPDPLHRRTAAAISAPRRR